MTITGTATDSPLHHAVTPLDGSTAAAVAWRSKGQLHVTVIAKATFAFAHGVEMPRAAPQAILRAEVHHGGNAARSVRFTSDLVPYLGRADVLFTGHAHAPEGAQATRVRVRLGVFDARRTILDKVVVAEDAAGFQRMPIVYERAFGGMEHPDNPLGVAAPSVVDPTDPKRPAGLGPIARSWPSRRRLLGATPRKALEGAVAEIPEGFDWSYFQAAPPDQRTAHLAGDEWIVMDGAHPTSPRVQMRLPRARGLARVHGLATFGVPEAQPLELRADTLRIDGDTQTCTCLLYTSDAADEL